MRIVSEARALVGESPWWDARRQLLWSVDVQGMALWRTDPLAGRTTIHAMPEMTGGVAGSADGKMVLALQTGLFLFDPDIPSAPVKLFAPPGLPATHRFNDLTVDSKGRLIVGTMKMSQVGAPEPTGVLYSFDGMRWSELRTGFYTINGLAVSPDGGTLYWSDSFPEVRTIWHAPYDAKTGKLGEARVFVDMHQHRGRPDGAAMDAEGGYWIAAIGGGCLHRFLPDGTRDRTIELPLEHPTKPAFGGTALDTLFVTSLSVRSSAQRPELAGALAALMPGAHGLAISDVHLA